jgi:hypothetical protein
MSDEELLESLDRHFAAGCLNLLPHQMNEHKATGTCRECRDRAKIASAATRPLTGTDAPSPRDEIEYTAADRSYDQWAFAQDYGS